MFKIIVSGVKTFYGQISKRNNPACTAETWTELGQGM